MIQCETINVEAEPDVMGALGPVEIGYVLKLGVMPEVRQNRVLVSERLEPADRKPGIARFKTARPVGAGNPIVLSRPIRAEPGCSTFESISV